jgi:hypothetical protein
MRSRIRGAKEVLKARFRREHCLMPWKSPLSSMAWKISAQTSFGSDDPSKVAFILYVMVVCGLSRTEEKGRARQRSNFAHVWVILICRPLARKHVQHSLTEY